MLHVRRANFRADKVRKNVCLRMDAMWYEYLCIYHFFLPRHEPLDVNNIFCDYKTCKKEIYNEWSKDKIIS